MAPRGSKIAAKSTSKGNSEEAPEIPPPSQVPLPPDTPDTPEPPSTPIKATTVGQETPESKFQRSSWYTRTWPRKAAPIAKLAGDTISTASDAASSVSSIAWNNAPAKISRSPSLALTRSNGASNRSLPAGATTTIINATSNSNPSTPKLEPRDENVLVTGTTASTKRNGGDRDESTQREAAPSKDGEGVKISDKTADGKTVAGVSTSSTSSAGWLGWLGKAPATTKSDVSSSAPNTSEVGQSIAEDKKDTEMGKPPEEGASPTPIVEETSSEVSPQSQPQEATSQKRSWLQMWSNTPSNTKKEPASNRLSTDTALASERAAQAGTAKDTTSVAPLASTHNVISNESSQADSKASSLVASPPPNLPNDGSKAGWIFWSRDRKPSTAQADGDHVGEIAISDTPTQKKPKRASINLDEGKGKADDLPKEAPKDGGKTGILGGRTKRQVASEPDSRLQPSQIESPTKGRKDTELEASKQLQKSVPNIVLPSFQDTFALQDNPSFWQQITRMLSYSKGPEPRHVNRARDPPRIKNAIAIGVHGYFPAPLIRSVLGQPTGTSIKFADMATKAIRSWTESHGYSCEVKSAALEGEGRIAERVEILWKLLLNWIEEIRKADFIFVACHSQGVPVAIMLVAKLIAFGCVNSARIGICAMAGVNLGPFPDYKSRWISGSAGELFEFSNPDSTVSRDYLAALETVLKFGVRVTYAGSIDDQLVSMDSSTFSPVSHPHIYRAVFVDGRVHAPNFLTHLVGFALKLRNLGVPDHGLVRELSAPLAGSLYTGEGHSRIYEEDAVYDLALEFALETTGIDQAPLSQRPGTPASQNPYILPFAMRGLLEEEYVRTELSQETSELLRQFDDWKPSSKVLKDVKFRLEGIRSKL